MARPHLISTALLLGCDYYQRGVQNIGIVTVFDILAEFGDEGNEEVDPHVILDRFTAYVREEIPARSEDSSRKLRLRRKKFNFPLGFPNCPAVGDAIKMYMQPSVSNETPRFSNLFLNIQKVEEILVQECGWSPNRLQKELETSNRKSRKLINFVTQPRINEFFASTKSKSFSPIVEPCSYDDYISANNNWMRKRKWPDESSLPIASRKRSFNIRAPPEPYTDDVITLDSD